MKKQSRMEVTHIVVHKTASRPDMKVEDLGKLPYHYLVTRDGELINLRQVFRIDKTIEIAWLGGIDKSGKHFDNRTNDQNDTLFTTLVMLSDRFPKASIVRADEIGTYDYPNPGFDIKKWLTEYIPAYLSGS